jgi:hypothetical protein
MKFRHCVFLWKRTRGPGGDKYNKILNVDNLSHLHCLALFEAIEVLVGLHWVLRHRFGVAA